MLVKPWKLLVHKLEKIRVYFQTICVSELTKWLLLKYECQIVTSKSSETKYRDVQILMSSVAVKKRD